MGVCLNIIKTTSITIPSNIGLDFGRVVGKQEVIDMSFVLYVKNPLELNNMITEDYVSFETAKLLKEKGFSGKCYKVWVYYTSSTPMLWSAPTFVEGETIVDRESVESAERTWNTIYGNSENKNYGYLAPTLQMAVKWLEEKYGVFCVIRRHGNKDDGFTYSWNCEGEMGLSVGNSGGFKTAAGACEAAIKYCLENLI